jgi:peptidoglycan hydrolase-like protein with peptidoglycan-binding domain
MKKFSTIASFALVAAFAVTMTASAAMDMGSMTLKKGSKDKTAVMALQSALNSCAGANLTVDGSFGMGTKKAVMAFQMSKSLTSDGVAGSMTKAALMSCDKTTDSSMNNGSNGSTGSVSLKGTTGDVKNFRELGTYSGENVYEGQMSHNVYQGEVEADAGSDISLSTLKLNFIQSNGNGSTLPSRYMSKVHVMLGSTEVGSAMVSDLSESGSNYTVNVPLSGAVVKASTKAQFTVAVDANSSLDTTDAGANTWTVKYLSTRFTDASGAILTNTPSSFIGKTFSFAKLSTSSIVKAKVSLDSSNPVAKTIKVDASSSVNDQTLLKFTVKAEGTDLKIRTLPVVVTVTNGSTVTQTTNAVATTSSTLVTLSAANTSIGAGMTVTGAGIAVGTTVSSISGTTLTFSQAATVPASTTLTFSASTSSVISSVKLSDGTSTLDSASLSGTGLTETATFGSTSALNYVIAKDTTKTFTVMVNVKSQTGYTAGSTVKVEFTSSNFLSTSATVIRDTLDNNLAGSATNRVGSALGDAMTLRTSGVSVNATSVVLGSANRNSTTSAITDQTVTYTLNVAATGNDFYIPRSVEYAPGTAASQTVAPTPAVAKGFTVALLNSSSNYPCAAIAGTCAAVEVPAANVSGSVSLVSGGVVDSNGLIRITDGTSAVVTVTVTLTDTVAASTPVGQYTFGLLSANAATTSSTTPTLAGYATLPYSAFQSSTTGSFTQ